MGPDRNFWANRLTKDWPSWGSELEKSSWIKILVFRFSSTSISRSSRSSLVGVGGCNNFSRTFLRLALNWQFTREVWSVNRLNFSSPSLEFRIFRSGSSTGLSSDIAMTNDHLFSDIALHFWQMSNIYQNFLSSWTELKLFQIFKNLCLRWQCRALTRTVLS